MPDECPLCSAYCTFENESPRLHLTHVKCDNDHTFYMPSSLIAVDKNDLDLHKIHSYNIMNEYLLAHGGHAIVDDTPCDFVFYTKENRLEDTENASLVDLENEMLNYPRSFTERIDRALLNLSRQYPHFGDGFKYHHTLARTLFLELGDSTAHSLHFLVDLGYLEYHNDSRHYISAQGWKHVAELTRYQLEVDQGFIAMAFRKETEEIRETFRSSIQDDCKFMVRIMDEKEHNNQIVPEMFYEIKRSRFMVVDITYPNYGAYYEAGYAQALGKEVIICCRKEEYESPDRKANPHFDIAQRSAVVWETYDELKDKLSKRIKATVTR
ncbi:MAG: hypothetical protein VB061_08460 [Christensenella sp.]|nr:hypothetical protein [Christensenella sp.]